MRKFLLFLLPLLLLFLSTVNLLNNYSFAEFSCTFSPSATLVVGQESNHYTISSLDADKHSNFGGNLFVNFTGPALFVPGYRRATVISYQVSPDENGNLQVDAEFLKNLSGLRAGELGISVKAAVDDSQALCSTSQTVLETSSQECNLSISSDSSGYVYLHADNVKNPLNSYDIEVRTDIQGDTDGSKTGGKIVIPNQNQSNSSFNKIAFPPHDKDHPYCAFNSELTGSGYFIGKLSTGYYYFEVKTGCNSFNNGKKCILSGQAVNATTGGTGGGSTCIFCPSGANWQNDGTCRNASDGKTVDPDPRSPANCITGETCNNNVGCVKSYDPGFDANNDKRNNICTHLSDDGKTCTSFDSGFDIPLSTDIGKFINNVLGIVLGISGGIAIIMIIISGYRLMISQGNPEKIQAAKEGLTAAIVGLMFAIFSLVILQVIGYDILRLPGFHP